MASPVRPELPASPRDATRTRPSRLLTGDEALTLARPADFRPGDPGFDEFIRGEPIPTRTLPFRPDEVPAGSRIRTLELTEEDSDRARQAARDFDERRARGAAEFRAGRSGGRPLPNVPGLESRPRRSVGRQPARSLLEAGVRRLPGGEDIIEGFEGLRPRDNLLEVLGAPFGISGLEPSDIGGGGLAKPGFIAGKRLRDVSLAALRDRRNAELQRLRTKFPAQTRQVEGMLEERLAAGRLGPLTVPVEGTAGAGALPRRGRARPGRFSLRSARRVG